MIQRKSLNITKQLGLWLILRCYLVQTGIWASYLMITDLGSSAEMIRREILKALVWGQMQFLKTQPLYTI